MHLTTFAEVDTGKSSVNPVSQVGDVNLSEINAGFEHTCDTGYFPLIYFRQPHIPSKAGINTVSKSARID